ncbi:MAG: SUMF1/EgtB/PvdO family nonheme iron enzyme, partial [Kofleriaceae bacterium]|nr:SUMF1/EgtB/PvdO family nonheme iron enzyme [Kofleriaceae bacterium]
DPAPNPLLISSDIDGQLARLQLRLMSKKPDSRPGYSDLIEELEQIVARLKGKRSQTAPRAMAVSDPDAKSSSPTPFLGRKQQANAVSLSNSKAQTSGAGVSDGAIDSNDGDSSDGDSMFLPSTKPSAALKFLTIFSALVLLAGAGLYFFGPLPTAATPTPVVNVPIDAGVPIAKAVLTDARPAPLAAPEGMLVIHPDEREKVFYISKSLVRYADYSAIFPREKRPTQNSKRQNAPVDGLKLNNAQSYARVKGGRLPTLAEWQAAKLHEDFSTQARVSEWLADEASGEAPSTISNTGKLTKRRSKGYKSVGFRLVIDLK